MATKTARASIFEVEGHMVSWPTKLRDIIDLDDSNGTIAWVRSRVEYVCTPTAINMHWKFVVECDNNADPQCPSEIDTGNIFAYLWTTYAGDLDDTPPAIAVRNTTSGPTSTKDDGTENVGVQRTLVLSETGEGYRTLVRDHWYGVRAKITNAQDLLFLDGFETGDTGEWDCEYPPGQRCSSTEVARLSQTGYRCFGGTSAAAPVVTGSAVLLEAWYHHTRGARPSPAMIKAILVAHADDLEGGIDHQTGSTIGHRPTMAQGWGRINVASAIQDSYDTVVLDEDHNPTNPTRRFRLGSGTSWSTAVEVDDPAEDVIIAMVFTDYPATNATSAYKVNDLDLSVRDGLAWIYCGNSFDTTTGRSIRHTTVQWPHCSYDPDNNVELVHVPGSELSGGDFTVQVTARTLSEKAVPGLDEGYSTNQDFAQYIFNGHLPQ